VIDALIAAGADANSTTKLGVTPLHAAVRTRCAAAVRALLAHGADSRRRNGKGSTPPHLAVQTTGRGGSGSSAAREQQREIIRVLLEHGARLDDKDASGCTVRDRIRSPWLVEAVFGGPASTERTTRPQ
jgi:ankyrin repeat protein